MSAAEPRWRWLSTREVHRGTVRIDADEVELPGGERLTYEVDRSAPYAVATLLATGGDVVLARRYRYPIDRWILDLPGGAGRLSESPESAARRAVEEELGLIADDLSPLQVFATDPGRRVAKTHLFFAPAARPGRATTGDTTAQVSVARLPLTELDRLIAEGEILDPALLIARAAAAAKGLLPPLGR
ncbi:NUDIX hydrolase [uncultured Microbacterium sp.]|uniref:NUDIX hydrolase n=1 Tax=uncultured Microbacterium sp. TaxID=191216 RepID=UPI0025E4E228|nr:NUDIX hydrolase [uncultured Microbacterium sp.]